MGEEPVSLREEFGKASIIDVASLLPFFQENWRRKWTQI
jgi:hypothetical protein